MARDILAAHPLVESHTQERGGIEQMPWTNDGWSEPQGERMGDRWWRGQMPYREMRESGPSVANRNTPIHRPHYSDERFARGREHTLFGATSKGLTYEYSDRLWQWDYDKAQRSSGWATSDHPWARNGSPAWWEIYLSAYFDRPWLSLRHIIGGVNVSSGYEYYIFGFRDDSRVTCFGGGRMKSARERAEQAIAYVFAHERESSRDVLAAMEVMFKEHARDQRLICCDEIMALDLCGDCPEAATYTRDDAYNAVLSTPAPGESQ